VAGVTTRGASPNPYVFIVGCARSGTTLVRRIVDSHPAIAITRETHWITKWLERGDGITPEGMARPEILESLMAHERFARMPIASGDLEALFEPDGALPYAAFVSGVFDLYGRAFGKRLVGDKTPAYVRSIPILHGLWPRARFVHVVRDGHDVALSAVSWRRSFRLARRFSTWSEEPYGTAAVWWDWLVRLGREAGGALGPALYHELRYERLVADPPGECAALCGFLGVPYDGSMLEYHDAPSRAPAGMYGKQRWEPITPGLRDWRSQMAAADVEAFEATSGPLLDELGYPRAVASPSAAAASKAARLRRSFARDLRGLGEPMPEAWAA
jgi:Sulfotransferase family